MMTPEEAEQWVRIGRDILISLVSTFMLIFAAVWERPPDEFVIGGAVALFGLVPALRIDERRRARGKTDDDAGV